MSVAGSVQLSPDLGLCRNRECKRQFKNVVGQGNLNVLGAALSQHVMFQRHHPRIFHLSGKLYRPLHLVPYRYNAIRCRSFLGPRQTFELPAVKNAATALIRSYNALQGTPTAVKIVRAIGIIIFAIWGLGPLMRKCRNLLFHKSESSWKKSGTYYVMTSYVQPLLLWSGAVLICRALDPVVLPTEASQIVKQRLLNFVGSLSTVLAFAYCLSNVIQQAQKFLMETNDPTDARNMGFQFAGRAVYSAVWVAAVSLFMELLGFSTQRWLTAGGLGTVLLTLAGREIFTNFLSSVMIHATRPFIVNEWIQTKIEGCEVSGTVEHVGWWSPTIIRGEDREAVHIPNHKFTMNVVRNLSQKTHWRIKTHLAISHLDVNKINNIVADMRKVLAKNPQVEQQRLHRRVFLDNVNPENQALLILISCFVKTSHFEEYLCVKEAILLDLLRVISHHRARLATPIRTVQKMYSDADMENVPFADSTFMHGGMASNRSLLLIEPPYRINGEDKGKSRLGRTTGEQDGKAAARSMPDSKNDAKEETKPVSDPKHIPESKADANSGELPSSDKDPRTPTSVSDTKVGEKVTTISSLGAVPSTNPKAAQKLSSDSKVLASDSDDSTQKVSDSKQKRPSLGSGTPAGKFGNLPVSLLEADDDKGGGSSAPSHLKQGSETSAVTQPTLPRSALEENIVLGVALEGSKRTLPIEEEMDLPSSSPEGKGLVANGNGARSSTGQKDQKDGQITAAPHASSGDK